MNKEMEKWKQDAEMSMFCGEFLKDLSKDELLAVIGHLQMDLKRQEDSHTKEREFMNLCDKHSNRPITPPTHPNLNPLYASLFIGAIS